MKIEGKFAGKKLKNILGKINRKIEGKLKEFIFSSDPHRS